MVSVDMRNPLDSSTGNGIVVVDKIIISQKSFFVTGDDKSSSSCNSV